MSKYTDYVKKLMGDGKTMKQAAASWGTKKTKTPKRTTKKR